MALLLFAATLAVMTVGFPTGQAMDTDYLPQKALLPAVHWNHDMSELQHLVPVNSHKLYYTADGVADPTLEHSFAHLDTAMAQPAVILDHSSKIDSVRCQEHDLKIVFTDQEAFAFAQKAWASEKDFLLATFTDGCGVSTEQRTFWLVDHFMPGPCDRCIKAIVDHEVPIEDAVHGADIVWGTYTPLEKPDKVRTIRRNALLRRQAGNVDQTAGECGSAPSELVDGLPTAECNSSTFDRDLDDEIGYLSFDEDKYSENLERFVPGLDDFSPDGNQGFGVLQNETAAGLDRRQIAGSYFGDRVRNALTDGFNTASAKLSQISAAVVEGARTVATKVANALTLSPEVRLNITLDDVSPKPDRLRSSPFGDALLLLEGTVNSKDLIAIANVVRPLVTGSSGESAGGGGPSSSGASASGGGPSSSDASAGGGVPSIGESAGGEVTASGKLALYCVDCGVGGQLQLGGSAKWSLAKGLERGNISVNGDINTNVNLGIDAEVKVNGKYQFPIGVVALTGFSVPGVIIVGPALSLAVVTKFQITLAGQILTGVAVNISNFSAYVDLVEESNSKFASSVPVATYVFNAASQFSATLSLELPIGLGVGIWIPPLKNFKKAVSIKEVPGFEGTLNYTSKATDSGQETDTDEDANEDEEVDEDVQTNDDIATDEITKDNCTNSIGYNFKFINTVSLKAFKEFTLKRDTKDLIDGCIRFGNTNSTNQTLLDSSESERKSKRQEPADVELLDYIESIDRNADPANDTLFQIINATAFASLDSTTRTTNGSQVPFAPDADLLRIQDLSGNNELVAHPDGNLYYTSLGGGSLFASVSGFIEGDASGRYFHYYPNAMTTYNVSRLRLSNEDQIPLTAQLIGLTPANYSQDGSDPSIYLAADTNDGVFFPITCDIQGQDSKVFLATDITQGIATLKEEDLRYTVTGGVVKDCYFLAWVAPNGTAEATSG
ncbi:MAG: hypothetical protein Q9204_002587 [Flavoplaca sp. TL-2023a]